MSSVIVPFQASYYFSSDTAANAENVSADGSVFSVTLNTPLQIPKASLTATCEIERASIWNVTPNISALLANNLFEFTTTDAGNPGTHTITIADGLYSLDNLNGFLGTAFANLGLSGNLILLTGDDATQRTILTYLIAADSVDFTIANSVRLILGFDSRISPAAPQAAGFSDFSDNTAEFNRVNSYIIRSNIVSEGIPINSTAAGILAQIPIPRDTVAGRQINYLPQNPIRVNASELISQTKMNFTFSLVDQLLRPTPTVGEVWDLTLTFRWNVLLTSQKVPLLSL